MKKTALHAQHLALGAKMGEFAGYDMPLFYPKGVLAEHNHVRSKAGLFDVSHMGQVTFKGEFIPKFLQKLTPSWFEKVKQGVAKYTVLMNEQGGIIDDLIITNMGDNRFFTVINAGCKDKDIAWFQKNLPEEIEMTIHDDRSLLALQGCSSEAVMEAVLGESYAEQGYMRAVEISHPSYGDLLVSRLGYTGEDGFEISVSSKQAPALWDALVGHDDVEPIGLAARDSLRLEMGYPLYGHDIDSETSPVEADLTWVISKNNTHFLGAERVLRELDKGASRKRMGVKLLDKGVAREGTDIYCQDGNRIGTMTSGGHSPTLNASIGMAYIVSEACEGTNTAYANVRGRNLALRFAEMPFVPAKTKITKNKDQAA